MMWFRYIFLKKVWYGDLDGNGNEWKGIEGSRKIITTKENKVGLEHVPHTALALIFLSRSIISPPHVCRWY